MQRAISSSAGTAFCSTWLLYSSTVLFKGPKSISISSGGAAADSPADASRSAKAGASQSRPISASCLRMARKSQTCAQGGSLVVTTRREPSGLKVATSTLVLVGAFEPRQRAAGLDLDQPEDFVGVLDDSKPAVRGEATKGHPRSASTSRQVPTSRRHVSRSSAISRRG